MYFFIKFFPLQVSVSNEIRVKTINYFELLKIKKNQHKAHGNRSSSSLKDAKLFRSVNLIV
jgi:hypothetical protein